MATTSNNTSVIDNLMNEIQQNNIINSITNIDTNIDTNSIKSYKKYEVKLDTSDYIKTNLGVRAYKDKNSGKYVMDAEIYKNYLESKNKLDEKSSRKAKKDAKKELDRQMKEGKRNEKLEKKKQTEEYKRKEAERKRKEEENEKKKLKKDLEKKEEDILNKSWRSFKCNKRHDHVKACVNMYYEMYCDQIDDKKWFAERGEKKKTKLKKNKENTSEDLKDQSKTTEAFETWVPDETIENQPYENDYELKKINYNNYGFIVGFDDNWDSNPWHRKIWNYILENPNGPGKEYLKDEFIKDPKLLQSLKSVEKNSNDDFLSGKEVNNIFKTEEELERERMYADAITNSQKEWEAANQTKKTEQYNEIYVYDEASGTLVLASDITGVRNIYNEGNTVQENLGGMMSGINSSMNVINQIITPRLTTYITTYVSNVLMAYTQDAIVKMLSFDASEIVDMAGKLTPNFIKTPGAIMKELLATSEDISADEVKKTEQEFLNKVNSIISDKAAGISQFVLKQLESVNNDIASISYYAQMGPAWVNDKIDKSLTKTIEFSCKYIGLARDFVDNEKKKVVENLAYAMAKKIAIKTNDQLEKMTKQKLDEVNNKKQQAINKAKSAILNAKIQIIALLGG